ncbi:MAG: hypothetical protein AB7P31_12160 [Steroidobacteraceae bacterium]
MPDETQPAASSTERVRAALAASRAPSRKDWSHFLRESLGLSKAKAEAYAACFARAGLVEEPQPSVDALAAAKKLLEHVAGLTAGADS